MSAAGARRKLDAFNDRHAQRRLPYYEILGVPQSATTMEITRAFRRLSLKLHPDKPGGSNEQFQELNKAYRCLKEAESRRKYEECGFDEDNIDTTEVDEFVDAFFGEGARRVDGISGDWNCGKIENYRHIDLTEVPLHMKDIVRIGLKYIVSLDHDFENVVLLQHSRVDILYLMVGYFSTGPLTQEIFESEESYPITYYDNPLQPGISPRWSDQNVLGQKRGKKKPVDLPRRELNFEEFQRRQKHALAMLENGPADPMAELEQKYRTKMLATAHQQARIADDKRREAICAQDVYENDAELDVNEFTDFLAQKKKARDEVSISADVPVTSSADEAQVASADAKRDCAEDKRANDTTSMAKYESQGTEKILGSSSDGVIFVAKGGEVLRNEGPPRPPREFDTHERVQDCVDICATPQPSHSNAVLCHDLRCFQHSMKALWRIVRS